MYPGIANPVCSYKMLSPGIEPKHKNELAYQRHALLWLRQTSSLSQFNYIPYLTVYLRHCKAVRLHSGIRAFPIPFALIKCWVLELNPSTKTNWPIRGMRCYDSDQRVSQGLKPGIKLKLKLHWVKSLDNENALRKTYRIVNFTNLWQKPCKNLTNPSLRPSN